MTMPDFVRQTGTRRPKELAAALEWEPDSIYAFPTDKGFDASLRVGTRRDAALDPRVTPIDLGDPTPLSPWKEEELKVFHEKMLLAAEDLRAGKKVLFVCVGGKNRSRAAMLCAMTLAGVSVDGLPEPEDERLLPLVGAIHSLEALLALAPLPKRSSRHQRFQPRDDSSPDEALDGWNDESPAKRQRIDEIDGAAQAPTP